MRTHRALGVGMVAMVVAWGGVQAQYFGKNKVRYGTFDWHIYHSQHFDVNYYPKVEPNLEKVVSLAESAYDYLSREFDFQIQEPTPLILYATHSEFLQNNIIINFIPEGVAAFATPARFRMVLPIDLPDTELYELILHELTHIFQYHIIFGGGLGRSLTLNPPQWLMEGMASYYAQDESTSDRMYLRDAVVNDRIPPVTSNAATGFFAYRFGHAVFDFMEERWGKDGVLDFIFEFRNTIGSRVGRAIERAFRMDPEDFDIEFRRWLRSRYLREFVETGEPSDFGRPFRTDEPNSQEVSPVASPSGDLVAAYSTLEQDVDIVLFDAQARRPVRNLTKGYTDDFRHFVGQGLTLGRRSGGDIAFSPDGNFVAAFVRKEAGYSLALINVLKGGVKRIIEMDVEQQSGPSWSPDGRHIAFGGSLNGQFDIFELDVETYEIRNLTNDAIYDAGPAYSPDGKRLIFSSVPEEMGQLFEIELPNPGPRFRITNDEFHNVDPVYSTDGQSVYFTSDRTGAENIYGLHLENKTLSQYTNTITGCFLPTVLRQEGGPDRLVYTGFWRGRFDLYENTVEEPIRVEQLEETRVETQITDIPTFEPDILVAIDESNIEDKRGFRLFLEDASAYVGIDSDQTVLGQVALTFSDFYGDRRLIALLNSVSSFQGFEVTYWDLSRRWQWSATLLDDRTFFIGRNFADGTIDRIQSAYRLTGATGRLTYPLSFHRRATFSFGAYDRDIDYQSFAFDSNGRPILDDEGNAIPIVRPRSDQFPEIGTSFIADTVIYGQAGASGGHALRFDVSWAPNLGDEGKNFDDEPGTTLQSIVQLDARKYIPLTRRSSFAMRGFGSIRGGDAPTPVYFGGFDTVRGVDFRDLTGDRGFYTNFELRFPLIDIFAFPFMAFQGIQGRIFLDIGGAWFDDVQDFKFWNSETNQLQDAISSYGLGLTVNFFGIDFHWDFGRLWNFNESGDNFTTFWVGQRF